MDFLFGLGLQNKAQCHDRWLLNGALQNRVSILRLLGNFIFFFFFKLTSKMQKMMYLEMCVYVGHVFYVLHTGVTIRWNLWVPSSEIHTYTATYKNLHKIPGVSL